VPVESCGQATAVHDPVKKGSDDVGVIVPLKPASHTQSPAATMVPVESCGQATAVHDPVKKGSDDVGVIVPLKPASHKQSPAATLVPVESAGQSTGKHSPVDEMAVPAPHAGKSVIPIPLVLEPPIDELSELPIDVLGELPLADDAPMSLIGIPIVPPIAP
jgi:hypothetical protein